MDQLEHVLNDIGLVTSIIANVVTVTAVIITFLRKRGSHVFAIRIDALILHIVIPPPLRLSDRETAPLLALMHAVFE
jgi:hypothetical protein